MREAHNGLEASVRGWPQLDVAAIRHGAEIGLCGSCMNARAISENQLVDGTHRSTLEELTDWTYSIWADKVISF